MRTPFTPLRIAAVAIITGLGSTASGQVKIGDNLTVIDPSAVLELESPNKALLVTRVALTSTTDVATVPNPKAGMVVYNTNAAITGTTTFPQSGAGLYYYNGSAWVFSGVGTLGNNFFSVNGNSNVADGVNFLGTTNAQPLNFRVNNQKAGRISLPAEGNLTLGALAGDQAVVNAAAFNAAFNNTLIGTEAGSGITIGDENTALGYQALQTTQNGSRNTGVGYRAGGSSVNNSSNTFLGYEADVTAGGVDSSTAIGIGARVSQSSSVILGNAGVTVGIGTSAPNSKLNVVGNTFTPGFTFGANTFYSGIFSQPDRLNVLPGDISYGVLSHTAANSTGTYNAIAGRVLNPNNSNAASLTAALGHVNQSPNTTGPDNNFRTAVLGIVNSRAGANTDAQVVSGLRLTDGLTGANAITPGSMQDSNTYAIFAGSSRKNFLSGSVGVGTANPANKLHVVPAVGADPLRLDSLQAGTANDSLLSVTATGVVKRVAVSRTGAIIKAGNGLTKTGDSISLGGALTATTTIAGDNNALIVSGSKNTATTGVIAAQLLVDNRTAALAGAAATGSMSRVVDTGTTGGSVWGAYNSAATSTNGTSQVIATNSEAASDFATLAGGTRVIGSLGRANAFGDGSGVSTRIIGSRGFAQIFGANKSFGAIGVDGFVEADNLANLNSVTVGGHFDGTSGGTQFGVIGQAEGQAGFDVMTNPALTGHKIGVAAVNVGGTGDSSLALYTEGKVRMRELALTPSSDSVLAIDGNGNIRAVTTASISDVVKAANGLTREGDSILLGGTLFRNTTVNGNQFGLTVRGGRNTANVNAQVASQLFVDNRTAAVSGVASTASTSRVVDTSTTGGSVWGAYNSAATSTNGTSQVIATNSEAASGFATVGAGTRVIGSLGRANAFGNGTGVGTRIIGSRGFAQIFGTGKSFGAIGVDGYVEADNLQNPGSVTVGGHFDGTSGGTQFGVIGQAEGQAGFDVMTNPALTGHKIGVAAVNVGGIGENSLALYTEGKVRMRELALIPSSDSVLAIDGNGNVRAVTTASISDVVSASNGLTRNGDSIELGGTLYKNTAITTSNGNTLTVAGTGNATQSAALTVAVIPSANLTQGADIFGGKATITGTDGLATASGAVTTLRAQINQGQSNGNNVRVQGSLNEASSGGTGLGASNQPAATGTTGLADYTGSGAAAADDYLVGVRGATYTSGQTTNALNVVGQTFSGSFARSIGGYFLPTNGTTNVGVVSQVGGTANQGWKDASLASRNVAVAALSYATGANDRAIYSEGNVQMTGLPATGNTQLVGIDGDGNLSTTAIPTFTDATTANNGLTETGNNIQLGGPLVATTDVALNGNSLTISSATNPIATFRNDGSIAMGNAGPLYADNKFEVRLNGVGGTTTAGEQNQGFNILGEALNGSALSVASRARLRVAPGTTVAGARGVQANVGIEGTLNGGAGAMFFNTNVASGATLGSGATLTGISGDAASAAGAPAGVATNRFTGGRFGASAINTPNATTIGVGTTAIGSVTSNTAVSATADAPANTVNHAGVVAAVGPIATVGTAVTTARTGRNVAVVAVNPAVAGTGATERAIYSSGGVQMRDLGTTTPTSLVGIDADGNLSTTAVPTFTDGTTANNGLTETGNNIQLGGPLVASTDVGLNGNTLTISNAANPVATFRNDGSIALGNAGPLYSSNKFEVRLNNVGGATTAGEENQGFNILAEALNGSNLSVASRARIRVAPGTSVTGVRGVQANVGIEGGLTGGAGAMFFNTNLAAGSTLGSSATLTGISGDAASAAGAPAGVATNRFTGARFGASAVNTPNATAFGVITTATGSVTSNTGVSATADAPAGTNNHAGVVAAVGPISSVSTDVNAARSGRNAAIIAVNPAVAGTGSVERAIYSSGGVQMTNLGTTAPTRLVGMDASGNLNNGFGILSATSTLTFSNVGSGTFADAPYSVPNAVPGDIVTLGITPADAPTGTVYFGYVSAADIVTIRVYNGTGGTLNASGPVKIKVMQ